MVATVPGGCCAASSAVLVAGADGAVVAAEVALDDTPAAGTELAGTPADPPAQADNMKAAATNVTVARISGIEARAMLRTRTRCSRNVHGLGSSDRTRILSRISV